MTSPMNMASSPGPGGEVDSNVQGTICPTWPTFAALISLVEVLDQGIGATPEEEEPLQRFLLGDHVRRNASVDQGWYVDAIQYCQMNTDDVVRYRLAMDLPTGTVDCGFFGDHELALVRRKEGG